MTAPETDTQDPGQEPQEKPKLTMEVQVDKTSACQRHITVTVSRKDVDRYLEEAYSELMPSAAVPGFRSGRAPRKLVEQRFKDQVSEQVKGSLLMDAMGQVSDDHDFSAISEPDFDFDAIEVPEEGPLTFEFDLEVRPEFDTPQWKGLALEKLTRKFTKKDIDAQLQSALNNQAEYVATDEPAEVNDFVTVDVTVRRNGEVLAESSNEVIQIKPILSFPDGRMEEFDKLMKGVKAGDKKTAKVTISHDAPVEDLQGEEVEVEFAVREVSRMELPEMDEDFFDAVGATNEGELRDLVQSGMERRLEYQQQQRIRKQITALLTQSADWDLPPDLVKRQAKRELERAMLELRSSGYTNEELRVYENEMRQNSLANTRTALKEHFILERIAEDEQVEAEPEDYDTEIALIARQEREPVRRVRARFEKRGMMDALRNHIIERKVIEKIKEHAKFKDVKYEPEVNETAAIELALSGRLESEIPQAKHDGDAQPLQQPADRT